jgi:hypothetical protein
VILCRDCTHIRKSQTFPACGALAHCTACVVAEPVNGVQGMLLCHEARAEGAKCGPEAVLFEQKPAEVKAENQVLCAK